MGVALFALFCRHKYGDPARLCTHPGALRQRPIDQALRTDQSVDRLNVDPDYYLVTLVGIVICIRMTTNISKPWTFSALCIGSALLLVLETVLFGMGIGHY
jgi:hypothetical protein